MALALPLLPPHLYPQATNSILEEIENATLENGNAQVFGNYLLTNWTQNPNVTSMYGVSLATDYSLELFRSKFGSIFQQSEHFSRTLGI